MTIVLIIVLVLSGHQGQVMLAGVPVPGATITATQGQKTFVAVTDPAGAYSFPDLADGPFTIQVEMLGFAPVKQEVTTPTAQFELKMLPLAEIKAEVVKAAPPEPAPTATASNSRTPAATPARPQAGFQRTEVNANTPANAAPANTAPAQPSQFSNLSQEDLSQRASDGLLINGTVNNGAASPFAQLAQIGNARRGRPLYNGNANVLIDSSVFNARSFSLTGQDTAKPNYNRLTGSFNIGGPLRIPGLIRNNAPTFFAGYQRVQNRSGDTQTGRMPTALERAGDFSQSTNRLGQPVQIIDPRTGVPFAGNLIPPDRISPEARTLLGLFPDPNFTENASYNYQIPIINSTHSDSVTGRINKAVNNRNQIAANIDIQSSRGDNVNLFNFLNTTRSRGINGSFQWTTRPTQRFSSTFRYQFGRQTNQVTLYFAGKFNVSGIAGITGNNQEEQNWGPPTLSFSGGTSSLSDGQFAHNRTQNHTVGYNGFWSRGRHNLTFGSDARRYMLNVLSQQDARGRFNFTGAAAGSDLAGFLLGIPDASSIAFGNADKYYRQMFYSAFVTDDWRMSGSLTLMLGARWEYETPSSELRGRLVNLNIAPDFSSVGPVVGNDQIRPDRFDIQPRISFAWRPIAASSLIVRGGYGVYRNSNVYQAIAVQMAQQSPLSKSLSVQNSPANPLTLANGFVSVAGTTPNTFAVDPNFRVGYAQTWQLSVQRDLPAALQMTAMYMGTKGTRLPQEFLPNTFPTAALNPSGYVYLTSNGNSIRNAGNIQLRRRLRNGFTATTSYTYASAFDNAPLMAGGVVTASQGGTSIAQNWLDLKGERAPSSGSPDFARHQFSVQGQYTTGVGLRGGFLMNGWRGPIFKDWTMSSNLNIASGLPQTPIYQGVVPGTGVTGNLRPDVTGVPVDQAPAGFFLNPAAYRVPAPGQWGNAGRNSITGPSQFSLNASLTRSFPWRDRYNIDVSVNAQNVLNHVTYRTWVTTISNAQFGLPGNVSPMRTVTTNVRLRF